MASDPALTTGRVMLVDDHPVVRAGYRRYLELEADLQWWGDVGSVEDALAMLDQQRPMRPDVIVVDLALPGRSGLELVKEVRRRDSRMRTLVFSMHDSAAIVSEALRLGAAGYVTKSSAPQELLCALRSVLRGEAPALSRDLATRHGDDLAQPLDQLTLREIEVLRRLAVGEDVHAVAAALHISPKTVANCQTALKHKLGAAAPVDLLRHAQSRGYLA